MDAWLMAAMKAIVVANRRQKWGYAEMVDQLSD